MRKRSSISAKERKDDKPLSPHLPHVRVRQLADRSGIFNDGVDDEERTALRVSMGSYHVFARTAKLRNCTFQISGSQTSPHPAFEGYAPNTHRRTTVPMKRILDPAMPPANKVIHKEGNVEKAVMVSKANLMSRP